MYLTYKDIASLFPYKKGMKDEDLSFHSVSTFANEKQNKGIFIPLEETSGELLEAIANGAICAVWDQNQQLPRYTPNLFPVFFTNNVLESVKDLLFLYRNKLQTAGKEGEYKTNFLFLDKILLNKFFKTYDIVEAKEILRKMLDGRLHGGKV